MPVSTTIAAGAPGIQTVGMVMAIAPDWRISAISENCARHLRLKAEDVLGRQAASILRPEILHAMRNRMALAGTSEGSERLFRWQLVDGGPLFDLNLQIADGHALIDLLTAAENEGFDVAAAVERMSRNCQGQASLAGVAERALRSIRAATGYDSIVLWRRDGTIAASCERVRDAFGFAAAPSCAEQFKVIADVRAEPCALLSDKLAALPDPGRALLAAPPAKLAVHFQSAGARSGFVIPVSSGETSWGTLAAYHGHPRMAGLARLSAVSLFTRILALEIAMLERSASA